MTTMTTMTTTMMTTMTTMTHRRMIMIMILSVLPSTPTKLQPILILTPPQPNSISPPPLRPAPTHPPTHPTSESDTVILPSTPTVSDSAPGGTLGASHQTAPGALTECVAQFIRQYGGDGNGGNCGNGGDSNGSMGLCLRGIPPRALCMPVPARDSLISTIQGSSTASFCWALRARARPTPHSALPCPTMPHRALPCPTMPYRDLPSKTAGLG